MRKLKEVVYYLDYHDLNRLGDSINDFVEDYSDQAWEAGPLVVKTRVSEDGETAFLFVQPLYCYEEAK